MLSILTEGLWEALKVIGLVYVFLCAAAVSVIFFAILEREIRDMRPKKEPACLKKKKPRRK